MIQNNVKEAGIFSVTIFLIMSFVSADTLQWSSLAVKKITVRNSAAQSLVRDIACIDNVYQGVAGFYNLLCVSKDDNNPNTVDPNPTVFYATYANWDDNGLADTEYGVWSISFKFARTLNVSWDEEGYYSYAEVLVYDMETGKPHLYLLKIWSDQKKCSAKVAYLRPYEEPAARE